MLSVHFTPSFRFMAQKHCFCERVMGSILSRGNNVRTQRGVTMVSPDLVQDMFSDYLWPTLQCAATLCVCWCTSQKHKKVNIRLHCTIDIIWGIFPTAAASVGTLKSMIHDVWLWWMTIQTISIYNREYTTGTFTILIVTSNWTEVTKLRWFTWILGSYVLFI